MCRFTLQPSLMLCSMYIYSIFHSSSSILSNDPYNGLTHRWINIHCIFLSISQFQMFYLVAYSIAQKYKYSDLISLAELSTGKCWDLRDRLKFNLV